MCAVELAIKDKLVFLNERRSNRFVMFNLHCNLPGFNWAILEAMREFECWGGGCAVVIILKGGPHWGLSQDMCLCPCVCLHVQDLCCRSAVIWKGIVMRRWFQQLLISYHHVLLSFLFFYPSIENNLLFLFNFFVMDQIVVFFFSMVPSEYVPLSQCL